ncbi:MAG: tetratricopeptide repeat protein [Alphaproteobacteria bacterium]
MIDGMASDHERLGTLLAEGIDHHRLGRIVEAARAYRAALALRPGQPDALHLLGQLAHEAGDVEGAVERVSAAVATSPEVVPFRATLTRIVAETVDRAVLRRALGRALARHPGSSAVAAATARVCFQAGDDDGAAAACRAALAADPSQRDVALDLAMLELRRGRRRAAESVLRSAAARHPDDLVVKARLGNLLRSLGRVDEAVELLAEARARDPSNAGLANDLALGLRAQGRLFGARDALDAAAAQEPAMAPAWINLSSVLAEIGDAEAAGAALDRAAALSPADRAVAEARVLQAPYRARFDGAGTRRAAALWAEGLESDPSARFAAMLEPERPLTIGFVSSGFRDRSAGNQLAAIWPAIDRRAFRIVGYDSGRTAVDETTARLSGQADAWVSIATLGDGDAAQRIRADGVDVLVDLTGAAPGHRLGIFARRAAPVQVAWLGHAGTTGLAAIDHLIADPVTVPPGEEGWYVERVWRLATAGLAFGVPDVALDPGTLPMGRDRPPTFACFAEPAQISQRTIDLWSRVIAETPGARIVLKSRAYAIDEVAAGTLARLSARGIPSDAVACEAQAGRGDRFARYRMVDMALDCWPVGGSQSVAEAMWMGVPTVRLAGDRMAGRIGEIFLRGAGLEAFVCADEDAYVACAVGWCRRRDDLAALRAGLRQRLFGSPAGNVSAVARELEATWRAMWRERCAAG